MSVDCGRVLLAEDNAANRKLALAMLGKLGYAADATVNGVEAVRAAGKVMYDAVLMDCRMPEMDGLRATAEIRRREASTSSRRTPIIAMTADAMEDDRRRCLEAGMDDYLSKPVSFGSLAAALERWIPRGGSPEAREPTPAEDHPEPEGHVLDSEVVSGLRKLGKDRGGAPMSRLIATFLRDAESNVERLRSAVEDRDQVTVAERSHTLIGSAATFGSRHMRERCAHLKALVTQGDFEGAGVALAGVEAELDRVRAALLAEFPSSEEAAT